MSFLPSVAYPAARPDEGYWGEVTSTLNWCEEDYYFTIYSAEIVNTLTNLLFIALGARGAINTIRYKHDSVYTVAFLGYMLVGAGSFAFHSTLKYPMQLVDELSMIYTACLMCYATFSYSRSRVFRQFLAFGLISLAIFITLYYHYLQDPLFHQNAFALLTATILFRAMYVMEINIRPSFRKKYGSVPQKQYRSQAEEDAADARDQRIVNEMWLLVGFGLSIFLGGFGLWNLDNMYCSRIRRWRHEIGLPWGILLEGHGWWHIMTGIGSYFYIVWGIWLRHCLNGRQEEYKLKWPSWYSIPEVVYRTERSTLNGTTNGTINGNTNGSSKAGIYSNGASKRQNNGYLNGHAKDE